MLGFGSLKFQPHLSLIFLAWCIFTIIIKNFFDRSTTMTCKNSFDSDKNTTHALSLNLSGVEPKIFSLNNILNLYD